MKRVIGHLLFRALLIIATAQAAHGQSISALVSGSAETQSVAVQPGPASGTVQQDATATINIPVALVTLYPGDVITSGMIAERSIPVDQVKQIAFARRGADMLGKAVRHVIVADQPVPLNALTEATVVTKGVATRVHLTEAGLTISGFAMPLESAGAGAMIRLKNIESGQVIVGIVEPNGSVRISMQ